MREPLITTLFWATKYFKTIYLASYAIRLSEYNSETSLFHK